VFRLFRRRRALPPDRRPALEREERILAWAGVDGTDAVIVATNRGLWLPGRSSRLGWHEIHKAVWSGSELAITPAAVVGERDGYQVMVDEPVESYRLTEPGDVPHHVRQRVTASVAYSRHHPLDGGGVRVVGRRVSGVDGLRWAVRYDPGTDAASPRVRQQTAELVRWARDATTPIG